MKFSSSKILFLGLIIISLFIRLSRLDFPLTGTFLWGDGTRDYLIADHIVRYFEFPRLGPYNLLFDNGIYSSPIYFYLLALILFFYNHILTLGIVNILLQLTVIILIYLVTKKLFGQTTALIASVLFSFNQEVLNHSDYIWQPYLMEPIAYLALLFLVQAIVLKTNLKLFLSIFLLSLSISIHHSAFPYLPIFLLISLFLLKRNHKSLMYYVATIIILALSMIFFYFPAILFKLEHPSSAVTKNSEIYIGSLVEYYSNLINNTNEFVAAFGMNFQSVPLFILIILSFAILIYFFKIKDSKTQKKFAILMLILIISPILFASLFNKIRLHYLILSMGPMAIFTAKIISSFSRYNIVISILLFLLFFKTFSSDFAFLKYHKKPLENNKLIEKITDAIKDQLSDYSSFQVKSFTRANSNEVFHYPILDTILLVPLEKALNQKLTLISDTSPYNHVQIGGNKYIILACYQIVCPTNYAILKTIYYNIYLSIHLAKPYD